MLHSLKVKVALIGLLGLLFTGCNLSGSNTDAQIREQNQPKTQPVAAANSDMSKMHMMNSEAPKNTSTNLVANQVVIQDFTFVPAVLKVKAGTQVTWVNRDDEPHTATDTEKRFNSSTLDTSGEFSFTFKERGTYNYFCALHPRMTGQIIVE